MGKLMRGAMMGGVGQGAAAAGQQILNAFMMKKKLDVQKQVAESQQAMNQSRMKRDDAYSNWMDRQGQLKASTDDETWNEAHGLVQANRGKKGAVAGPGSTSAQLATRYAGPGPEASPEIASPPMGAESLLSDGPATPQGVAPMPQGVAQMNPMPNRSAMRPPAVQSPAMPPIPPADPRSLVAPPQPFDPALYQSDNDAT